MTDRVRLVHETAADLAPALARKAEERDAAAEELAPT
jgi:hypothetical protein